MKLVIWTQWQIKDIYRIKLEKKKSKAVSEFLSTINHPEGSEVCPAAFHCPLVKWLDHFQLKVKVSFLYFLNQKDFGVKAQHCTCLFAVTPRAIINNQLSLHALGTTGKKQQIRLWVTVGFFPFFFFIANTFKPMAESNLTERT